jgi:preprotein translocase subunit SecF
MENKVKFPFRLVPENTNINFIKYKWVAFIFSIMLSAMAILGLATKGLNYGVDFKGGVVLEVAFAQAPQAKTLREFMAKHGYPSANVQMVEGSNIALIRFQPETDDAASEEINSIKAELLEAFGKETVFRKVDFVGPKVGQELIEKSIMAVVLSIVGILIYIAFRFNWQFGIGAVVSLVHDAIAILGFYVVSQIEFDVSAIAAILTVLGYSINDTVVIYDRIRENLGKHKGLANIINRSINETLSRTVMTVATTILACIALVLFGGEVLKGFSIAMLFGIVFGTYSSVYIAAPILLYTKAKNTN